MGQLNDDMFDALANKQRRELLFALTEKSPQIDSSVNLDTPPDAISPDEIDRISRQHVHLPKLDDYGFINWMPNINTVERGHRFEEIKSVLELLYVHQKGVSQAHNLDD